MYFVNYSFLTYFLLYFEVLRNENFILGSYEIEFELYEVNKAMSNQVLSLKNRSHKLALKIQPTITQHSQEDYLASQSRLEYTDNIQNGLLVRLNHIRQKTITNIFSGLLCINVLMLYIYVSASAIQYQMDFDKNEYVYSWFMLTYFVHIACNAVYVMLLVISFENLSRIQKNDYNYLVDFLKIIAFFVIHPMPWFNSATISITYQDHIYQNMQFPFKINYVILIITILKNIIVFLSKIIINSRFVGPRPNRVKKIFSVHSGSSIYAMRCIFREVPIKVFVGFFTLGVIYFSFSLQVTESGVPVYNNPFVYFQNCLWFIIITCTSVGYGELKIFTHFGYLWSLACLVWSSLCVSCILVILINTLTLNSKEQASLTQLKKVEKRMAYKELCKTYIRVSLWRLWRNRKNSAKIKQSTFQRKLRIRLRDIRRQGKTYNSTGNISILTQRQFDNSLINVSYLLQNNRQLLNFISNHIFSEQLGQYASTQKQEDKSEEEGSGQEMMAVSKKDVYPQKKSSSKHIKIKMLKQSSISFSNISEYSSLG